MGSVTRGPWSLAARAQAHSRRRREMAITYGADGAIVSYLHR